MSDLPKKAEDKINTFGIAVIGVVSSLLVWASIVALQAYYGATGSALEQEREVAGQSSQLRTIRAEHEGQLNPDKVETVDAKKGTVRVPIEYAMGKVVDTLSANPTASAVPVVGAHDTPTVPAAWGRPADDAKVEPAGEQPGEQPSAPDGTAPTGNAPAGNAPAGNTPTGNAPAGNAPAGNAPAGNAPAGNAPGNQPQPGAQ